MPPVGKDEHLKKWFFYQTSWIAADQSQVLKIKSCLFFFKGPPVVIPMGRALRNEGVYLDPRFKVLKSIHSDCFL